MFGSFVNFSAINSASVCVLASDACELPAATSFPAASVLMKHLILPFLRTQIEISGAESAAIKRLSLEEGRHSRNRRVALRHRSVTVSCNWNETRHTKPAWVIFHSPENNPKIYDCQSINFNSIYVAMRSFYSIDKTFQSRLCDWISRRFVPCFSLFDTAWKKNLSHRMGNRLTFSFPRIPPCESESSSSSIGWFIGFIRHQLRHNDHHTLVSNDAIFLAVIALESGETLEQEATKNYGIKWATIFSLIFSFFYFIFLFISSSSERKIFSCLSYKIIIFFLFII